MVMGSSLTSTTIDCSACAKAGAAMPHRLTKTASTATAAMHVHRVSFKYATTLEGCPRAGRGTDAGSRLLIVRVGRFGTQGAESVGLCLIGAEIFQRQIHHHPLLGFEIAILNVALFVGHSQRQAVVLEANADAVADRLLVLQVVAEAGEECPRIGEGQSAPADDFLPALLIVVLGLRRDDVCRPRFP